VIEVLEELQPQGPAAYLADLVGPVLGEAFLRLLVCQSLLTAVERFEDHLPLETVTRAFGVTRFQGHAHDLLHRRLAGPYAGRRCERVSACWKHFGDQHANTCNLLSRA
jgi:hypothetical protein